MRVLQANHVSDMGYGCYRGQREDVLDRYIQAARSANADVCDPG